MKFFAALLCFFALSQAFRVDPKIWEDFDREGVASFSIHLRSKADLDGARFLDRKDHTGRGWFVLNALRTHSAKSQANLLEFLRGNKDVLRVTPYYIANFIVVEAKRSVVEALLSHHEIQAINSNRPFKVNLETPEEEPIFNRVKADEWNIDWVGAPKVWQTYGTTGDFIFANADTGVEFSHPALLPNYKGNNNGTYNHNYNWWDGVKTAALPGSGKCGINSQVPCDDNGHGTHTTGTAVGQDGIGVAPGARWIGCRNMDRGYGTVESYMSCLQFFLAPTNLQGSNPDPSVRPLAIGNSYGCVSSEGCSGGEFTEAVEALRAAGVFMSVSAGNSGPTCNTMRDPPATEPSVISVGATGLRSDTIASYSSRGPVGTAKKPTLVAPGSSVRSCVPGGGYSSFSGTSMASPHVGGFVNLIVAVCPDLMYDVDALEDLIITTTRPLYSTQGCGGDTGNSYPNNVYGYGQLAIDAAAAKCRA